MIKTLNSGIKVNSQEYYKLLEWRNINMIKFTDWCDEKKTLNSYRISDLGEKYYNELVKFAGI